EVVPDPTARRTLPIVRELQENFKRYAGQGVELNSTLLEGYLAAKVLVEGLRRAGPNPTSRKLRDALESMREFDAGGMHIAFSNVRLMARMKSAGQSALRLMRNRRAAPRSRASSCAAATS